VALFVVAYNFCKVHTTIKTTPAAQAGLAKEKWTVEQLVAALSETI
jgi:hypothetical protein